MSISINKEFISRENISGTGNSCQYIIIHETDNISRGAGARTHAKAQQGGHFANMSVHYYCGSDGIYQAAEHTYRCWHIGREYGGDHAVSDATNSNSLGIEICVNSDGDYIEARQNAIILVRELLQTTTIPISHVIRHYDAKGKYCPRKMMDTPSLWSDFKNQCNGNPAGGNPHSLHEPAGPDYIKEAQKAINNKFPETLTVDGIWGSKSKAAWTRAVQRTLNQEYHKALKVDGVFGQQTKAAIVQIKMGDTNLLVGVLQIGLCAHCYDVKGIDCIFGKNTRTATETFQKQGGLRIDGIAGRETFFALAQ